MAAKRETTVQVPFNGQNMAILNVMGNLNIDLQ